MNNLAAREPDRLQRMIAQWEAWAHRAHVLPWIWEPAYGDPGASQKTKAKKRAKQ